MDNSGGRLGLMAFLGFLLIQIALSGKLGSVLAAIIDPVNLLEQNQPGSAATGLIGGLPTTGTLTPTQIGEYAINAGFGASSLVTAIAVALAESGGNVTATNHDANGTTDYGLWQINSVHSSYSPSKLLTPAYNAQAAYDISAGGSNWNPWSTYTSGAYLAQMATAQQAALAAAAANVGVQPNG